MSAGMMPLAVGSISFGPSTSIAQEGARRLSIVPASHQALVGRRAALLAELADIDRQLEDEARRYRGQRDALHRQFLAECPDAATVKGPLAQLADLAEGRQ